MSRNTRSSHTRNSDQQHTHIKPQVGVSGCLMGQLVRFDGGHKRNAFVIDECQQYFDLHTVCPEVELGLGTPRPVIQLRRFEDKVHLVHSKQIENDISDEMRAFAEQRVEGLSHLDGFIFKKDSPSCGMERVPVYDNRTGMRERNGVGIFAQAFRQKYPNVPTEEEGRLNDRKLRENFLERVYAHVRWREIEQAENPLKAFREYHKNYKLILMAKNTEAYRQLGRIAATVSKKNFASVREVYFTRFMQVMAIVPSRGQHVNVLMHILGYLKNHLPSHDKQELLAWFENYRDEQVHRITPMVLLKHHFNHYPDDYIAEQYYLSPFPEKLMQPV